MVFFQTCRDYKRLVLCHVCRCRPRRDGRGPNKVSESHVSYPFYLLLSVRVVIVHILCSKVSQNLGRTLYHKPSLIQV